ncbi:porin [Wenyingzhuangia sp. 2_MG-2023]|uniref:porin n=1 Tax=Wenyingzhuangia sp. 2_MG-2023 TaxID=3062639 RepID=UPI0026E1DA2B|nr:porin [Wenyingzhuangia sp. 2_MG-2023]MDO6739001.1 porin [Wenyingzhuangia sp. 2_MG-2023]
MKEFKYIMLISVLVLTAVNAQEKEFKPKVNWSLTTQIWLRYSELNEGTTMNGESTKSFADVSIRRLRIPVSSQITPKIYAYALLGGNNYNIGVSSSKDFPLQVLDLYAEYGFSKAFEAGVGKSGWQGLNRWNVRSSKSLMGLDSPLFTLNEVNKTDDLGRNVGVWFKGQVAKFDYRLVFNNPIMVTTAPSGATDFANNRPRVKTSSYVKYQFWEEESNKSSYQTGTYINTKKVWNIGAGFQYQKKAMSDGDVSDSSTNYYDLKHWAVDSFLSLPLNKDDGITAYLGYYHYGFGKDYIRNVGANNPGFSGGDDFNGAGVAFPMIGTGDTFYTQFGYAFSRAKVLGKELIFQPNIAIQHSNWDALNESMTLYDFTLNCFLNGHGNKLSLGYQYRPVFDEVSLKEKDRKGMAVLQYQITIK